MGVGCTDAGGAVSSLSHLGPGGDAHMVDVSRKQDSIRVAKAEARVMMSPEAFEALKKGQSKKGDVLGSARVAGIMAAKQTSALIPLCHPIRIAGAGVEFELLSDGVRVEATVRAVDHTGVEMEALTAASVAALTIYDMLKAVDRSIRIDAVRLLEKSGGKSGDFKA